MYRPPKVSTGKPSDNFECDIMENSTYISGYSCSGSCQMDRTLSVEVFCNCQENSGAIFFIKKCEWEYRNRPCPKVPEVEIKYDWECNPLETRCLEGQYRDFAAAELPVMAKSNFITGAHFNELEEYAPAFTRENYTPRNNQFQRLENKVTFTKIRACPKKYIF